MSGWAPVTGLTTGNGSHLCMQVRGHLNVTVPFTQYQAASNTVRYSTNSGIKLNVNAGAGVNYFLSKSIILLLEARTFSVLNLPQNHSVDLSGISLLVNIKITL
jgi:hypothetical protein